MYNFGSFDAFIVKPTIMPDFARNLLHYESKYYQQSFTFLSRACRFYELGREIDLQYDFEVVLYL